MLIDEVVRLFLRSREQGITGAKKRARPETLRTYGQDLSVLTKHFHERGIVRYENIRRPDMRDFVDAVNSKDGWSLARKLRLLRTLRAMFRWVAIDEDCKEDIEGGLKSWAKSLPAIEKTPSRKFIPTTDQLKKFKNGFKTTTRDGYRDYIVASLLTDCGMRIGELCNLKMDHLKMDDRLLLVPETGKTGSRLVPIRTDVVRMLKGWLRIRSRYAKPSVDFVFVNREGEPCTVFTFAQSFRRNCARNGLPRITPHTLRHAFCTYYLRGGGDIAKLKLITGHSSYQMLDNYVHLAEVGGTQMQEELERVSPLRQIETGR